MDCKIFKSEQTIDVKDLNRNLESLDFYNQEKKDIAIFHYNLIQDNVYHIVFKIDEEFCTASRYISNFSTVPIDIYINTFIFIKENCICIENIYSEYCDLILKYVPLVTKVNFAKPTFTQEKILFILKNKTNQILQYECEDEDGYYTYENRLEINNAIKERKKIEYVNFTPNLAGYGNILVSLKKSSEINIKANIPNILINLIQYFLSDQND